MIRKRKILCGLGRASASEKNSLAPGEYVLSTEAVVSAAAPMPTPKSDLKDVADPMHR